MANKTISRYKSMRHILDLPLELINQQDKSSNIQYTAKEGELLTDVAFKELDDAQYYWVLASINNILNPFEPMKLNQKIYIPPKSILKDL